MCFSKFHLVEVALKCNDGYSICTGYAITNELILTAGHITEEKYNGTLKVEIRFVGENEDWIQGEIIWRIIEYNLDAALIKLNQKRPGENRTYLGIVSNKNEWHGAGFPNAGKFTTSKDRTVNDTVGISGIIEMGGNLISGLMDLTVKSGPSSAEQWKGLSGSPVFIDGFLVGVITSAPNAFEGRRLKATSIEALKKNKKFDDLTSEVVCYNNNVFREKFKEIYRQQKSLNNTDNSINTPNRKIEKLNGLLNINEILSQQEKDILFISLYMYSLPIDILNNQENFLFIEDATFQFSKTLLKIIDEEQNLQSVRSLFQPHRGDLLYSLIKFINFLEFEKSSLNDDSIAPICSNIYDWFTYLIHSILIKKGIITYITRLNISDAKFQTDLMGFIRYLYDKVYYNYRNIFNNYGIPITRAETQIIFDKNVCQVPIAVKKAFVKEKNKIIDDLKPIYHLGEIQIVPFKQLINRYKLDDIIPLPYSLILDRFDINLPDSVNYSCSYVEVESNQFDNYVGEEIELMPLNNNVSIMICGNQIVPNSTYRWYLKKFNDDFVNQITSGIFKTFSCENESLFSSLTGHTNEDIHSLISIRNSFGLWNMLVSDIWEKDIVNITEDELLLLFHIFQEAISWLEKWDWESGRIEIYRNLCIDLYDIIINYNLKNRNYEIT